MLPVSSSLSASMPGLLASETRECMFSLTCNNVIPPAAEPLTAGLLVVLGPVRLLQGPAGIQAVGRGGMLASS